MERGKVKVSETMHTLVRSVNFFFQIWLMIIAAAYSGYAEINFGIIGACLSVQIPLNYLAGVLFWNEKLTLRSILGTIVILFGVIWIAISRGTPGKDPLNNYTEEEKEFYKWVAIGVALLSGTLTAVRI